MSDAWSGEQGAEFSVVETSVDARGGAAPPKYWAGKRLHLRKWLTELRPSLAELHVGAVELVYGPALPGRVRFICHAIREIKNRLPEVLSGAGQAGRVDYVSRMDKVSKIAHRGSADSDPKALPSPSEIEVALNHQLLAEATSSLAMDEAPPYTPQFRLTCSP